MVLINYGAVPYYTIQVKRVLKLCCVQVKYGIVLYYKGVNYGSS